MSADACPRVATEADGPAPAAAYRLEEQAGFLLRRASQRHLAIFARLIPDLTPPQWAAMAALRELGGLERGGIAQNRLGQAVAMDAATIKGVIDRLKARGLVVLRGDEADRRRVMVRLSGEGETLVERLAPLAAAITAETLAPLTGREAETLRRLLEKLG